MSHNNSGFTLIELIIAMVIISIALSGTILVFHTAGRSSSDPMIAQQAVSIGKSYLEEILAKNFPTGLPCSAPPVAGRSEYTNVCDYSGMSDTGARNQIGQAISGLENYNVQVTLDSTTATLGSLTSGTEVVRIDVAVSHNAIATVTISGYRTSY